MSAPATRSAATHRSPADHCRVRSSAGPVHDHAPNVFLRPPSTRPSSRRFRRSSFSRSGLTFIIGAGEIDLCFPAIFGFSGFVFAVLFKEYRPGLDRRDRRLRFRHSRRLHQRPARREARHSIVHRDARHAVLLVRHGDAYCRGASPMRCAAPRRVRFGRCSSAGSSLAADQYAWFKQHLRCKALWTALIVILAVVHPQSPPLWRTHPVYRRFERCVARRRHRRRPREDQAVHPHGRACRHSPPSS